jgi:hypothetical protein
MTTAEAFYLPLGEDRYAATALTRGPWNQDTQHAGPPSALLGRAVEQLPDARPGFRVARMTFEILRPVPIAELTVSTRLAEAGRSVERIEAALTGPDGRVAIRATALRIRTEDGAAPEVGQPLSVPGPDDSPPSPFPVPWAEGYHTAVDTRFASGGFTEPGPAVCWFRLRQPLVAGEEPSGLCRVLVAADSGNGISSELDITRHMYINPDLSVHLHRHPVGEWIGLDARTTIDQSGIGLATSRLLDEKSVIGRAAQSLYVAGR